MTESDINQPFTFMVLWQALLGHHFDAAIALCESQLKSDNPIPVTIATLVIALKTPASVADILTTLAEQERSAQGWQALFFGIANLSAGRMDNAFSLFETAAETEASRSPALVYLAALYLVQNQVEMVDETIREGLSLNQEIGEFHTLKARLLIQQAAQEKADKEQLFAEAATQIEIAREKGNCSQLNLAHFELDLLLAQNQQAQAIQLAVTLLEKGLEGVSQDEISTIGLSALISCGALDEANNYLDQALEITPDNLILLTYRAETAALNGRFHVAAAAITRALKQDEDNIDLLHKKSGLVGQGFSYKESVKALDKLIELTKKLPPPNRAIYMATYGDIYFDQDEVEKAEQAFNDALIVDENCIPALAGLSQILTTLGRLDEARAAQERVYQIAPVRAMQMMINADHVPEGDKEISRMEEMAANPRIALQMRASLNLSLAKVSQKRGHHEKAMSFAHKANKIIRSYVHYNYQNEAKHVDQIIAQMSKNFFTDRKEFGSDSDLPIFILGMPRSGTTLVEQIVGGHSAVFPGGELGHIPRMWQRLVVWESRMGSEYHRMPDCVVELTSEQSIEFAEKVEGEYRELMSADFGNVGSEKTHITDKLPHNFKNVGLIRLLYPKAKIIYCRRSAGGIALSNYFTDYKARHGGMGFAYDLDGIGSEIANCQRLMDHWVKLFGDAIHIVDYEELVDNPEPTVKKMFDYLDLSWEEQVMDFSNLKRAVKTASVTQVRQPMYTSSKEKWLKYEEQLQPMFKALDKRKTETPPEPMALPVHEPGLFLKGMALLENAQNAEAEVLFKSILDTYPRHAAAMHMLGAAYSNQGKILPAHKCMKRSIQLHPGNHTWYGNLAIILEHMQSPDEAREVREKGEKVAKRWGYIPDRQ